MTNGGGCKKDPTDPESSRHGDAKESGGQTANANEAGDGPLFMSGSDLNSPFILAGEEVEIDTSKLGNGSSRARLHCRKAGWLSRRHLRQRHMGSRQMGCRHRA